MEVRGRHVAQRDAVLGQQLGQGVHRAPVFKVSHHGDLEVTERTLDGHHQLIINPDRGKLMYKVL